MRSTKVSRSARRLIRLSVLTAVLATVAAANLTLTYLLYVTGQPGSNIAGFGPIMVIGAVPFLLTAGLLAWVIVSAGSSISEGQRPQQQAIGPLRLITGFGLPFMILGGLWSGLAAALLGLEQDSPAGFSLTLFQFTFLPPGVSRTVTLIVALSPRSSPPTSHGVWLRRKSRGRWFPTR